MGLQVRLRHALGEKLFDLPDRPVENPLIVGRAREAEVKIPSVTVASQHCALFLHDGQWVLQDTSGGSTWVNESAIEGPTPLCVGDVIMLGSDATPATLEIDPAGVAEGRTGRPAETQEVASMPAAIAPMPAPRQPTARPAVRPSASPGYYGSAPPAAPPQMSRPAAASNDPWGNAGGEDSIEGWGQPASADATTSTRRRKPKKKMSDAGLIIGIGVGVLVLAAGGFGVYKVMNPDVPPPVVVPPPSAPVKHPNSIFDAGINTPNPGKETVASAVKSPAPTGRHAVAPAAAPKEMETPDGSSTPTPPAPSADANATPSEASADVHKDDKAWNEVEGATSSPDIGQAILKFDDYRRQHPGAFTKELDAYTDEAMDRLWWKRIGLLCAKRDSLNADIKKTEKDIRDETSADFKKKLEGEKKDFQTKLALVQEHLVSDMGYTADETPDIDNTQTMAKLTADRDASKFGRWKLSTLKYIRINHGSAPWDGE